MPAKFIPDTKRGPGNGLIVVNPISCKSAPTFALYRSSDRLCLSEEGWQSSEVFLKPRTWNCHDNALLLAVDNSVVNCLDKLNTYKIVVKEGDANESFTLSIEDIIQATLDGGQGVGMGGCTAIPLQEQRPEQGAHTEDVALQDEPKVEPKTEPMPSLAQRTPPSSEGNLDKISMPKGEIPQKKTGGKKKGMLLIMIFLVLALLGGAFWWFMQYGQNIPVATPTKENGVRENVVRENVVVDKPKTAKTEETQRVPVQRKTSSAMDEARVLLRKNEDGAASKTLADSLRQLAANDSLAQDAVFLLLEDAAQKGEISAMRELGNFYDPTITAGKGSITPDVREAYSWYAKALQGGDTKAIADLNRLRVQVKKIAKDGDADAVQLLRNW